MRILLVANTLPPTDLSGVGEQVIQLARGLEARGHEVRVLGRGAAGLRASKLLFPITIVGPFLKEIRRFRPDVVQVHESDGALAALVLKTLAPLSPEPVLSALLQVSYWQELKAVRAIRYRGRVLGRPGVREILFRWFKAPVQVVLGCLTAWLADRVLAPSAATAQELGRDYRAEAVSVVPNAMAPLDGPPRDAGGTVAAPSEISSPPPAALFVGRLRIRKGLEVALEAFASMLGDPAGNDEAPRLLIVGDGEHRAGLEASAARQGLGDRVAFLGRRSRAEVEALMDTARVLVVPSLYEGMPLVIVEAMQRGLAVVASAVSGIPEVVLDGETGWLVPCEDPVALADALREAFEDEGEARARGLKGRKRLETEFSPDHAAEIWERALGLREDPAALETGSTAR